MRLLRKVGRLLVSASTIYFLRSLGGTRILWRHDCIGMTKHKQAETVSNNWKSAINYIKHMHAVKVLSRDLGTEALYVLYPKSKTIGQPFHDLWVFLFHKVEELLSK